MYGYYSRGATIKSVAFNQVNTMCIITINKIKLILIIKNNFSYITISEILF